MAQILHSASVAAAAARCDEVASAAVLLRSAINGPGFDSRGSCDVAMDMFQEREMTNKNY